MTAKAVRSYYYYQTKPNCNPAGQCKKQYKYIYRYGLTVLYISGAVVIGLEFVGSSEFNAAGLTYIVHSISCVGDEYGLNECLKNVSLQTCESGLPASVTCQGGF